MKRKNVLAIAMAFLMLVCCLGGCAQKDDSAAEVERLQQEIAALNAQIEALEQQKKELGKEDVSLETGDHVNHTEFGDGVVISVDKSIVTIAFPHPHGVKKMMKNHKSLTKV